MNQHLVQAIAAARAGKNPQAKVLLARVIKDEPENVNAWYLLSSLADTEEQKIQHLQKVLELQPNHPTAAQQLAELVPEPPQPIVEAIPSFEDEDFGDTATYPVPDFDDAPSADVPDDPDEAMAWLERLAADQGARLEELPTLSGGYTKTVSEPLLEEMETADPTLEIPALDLSEMESAPEQDFYQSEMVESDVPDDPDEAMAWLERLAADQGANLDELPSLFEVETAEETESEEEDVFSWLDEEMGEDEDFLDTLLEAPEPQSQGEDTPRLTVSNDLDFVSQSKGDSIPSWLVDDEEFIAGDTIITGAAAEAAEMPAAENLPDWLNEGPPEDWSGAEGEKSGHVVWKPGEGDESRKPTPPTTKKATKPAARQTAAAGGGNSLLLLFLVFVALVLIFAIFYILINQPL